jgi:hypothetical protein
MSGRRDLIIEQGASFSLPISLRNASDNSIFELTGYTPYGQIRKTYRSVDVTAEFTFNVDTPLTAGTMTILLDADVTSVITCGNSINDSASKYVYDIVIRHTDGTVKRVIDGIIYVSPGVTRIPSVSESPSVSPSESPSLSPSED